MIFLQRSELLSRSGRLLTLGAATMSSLLAPTILGAASLALLQPHVSQSDVLRFFLITIPLGGLVGGLAMHLAVRVPSAALLVGNACFGGVLFLTGTAMVHAILDGDPLSLLAAVLIFGLYGSLFSVPCGLLFGLLMLGMFGPAKKHLEAPAQDSPLCVAQIVARVFMLAAGLALLAAWAVKGPYEVTLSHMLAAGIGELPEGPALAWTRFLFATPLALIAALLWAYAQLQAWKLHRERSAIGRRTNGRWSMSDMAAWLATPVNPAATRRSVRVPLLAPSGEHTALCQPSSRWSLR